ncbi:flavodoxin-like protein [Gregarina niphandrodes]|uniref:Flavodoxin-like protein n=1 Tax=Gregarina niphandrodes TaxID=110365 RepID=A0A023B3X8_GRENI|nr:flavodoxin-like protein [Gregarina niphandrodes]EZG56100.1 flavodoxin-like protein [Gregarina niphandrodes]|eukprot:XP_011131333.1 flavodoxin-like protein [Gregarina niphandrodes]
MFRLCTAVEGPELEGEDVQLREQIMVGASRYADELIMRRHRVCGARKILIVTCTESWGYSQGKLNRLLADVAATHLAAGGCEVRMFECTEVNSSQWNAEQEVKNIVWADAIIFQFPVWWFSHPWAMKKWFDRGWLVGKVCANDGRTRKDPTKRYGTGGLLNDKFYMISSTWNAPQPIFRDPEGIFYGLGTDMSLNAVHVTGSFTGMTALESFSCHDVMKDPQIDADIDRYKIHLNRVFDLHATTPTHLNKMSSDLKSAAPSSESFFGN